MALTYGLNIFKRCIHSATSPLFIKFTDTLCAEPLKKKRKLDPAIIKQREERKKRRLEKQIRRLEKNERQFKPIIECEIPLEIINNPKLHARTKTASRGSVEVRISMLKQWSQLRVNQNLNDALMIDRIIDSHQRALDNLKLISPELYKAAIEAEPNFIPFKAVGPAETPPIDNFDSPDGEYVDISKKWE